MYYTNFDRAITEKYHVILVGWPLEKFCSPSDIASRNEVSVLMASFESGATRFRKLSPTEFEKWTEECLNPAVNSSPDATVTSSSSSLLLLMELLSRLSLLHQLHLLALKNLALKSPCQMRDQDQELRQEGSRTLI
jgi:hypothetical protein